MSMSATPTNEDETLVAVSFTHPGPLGLHLRVLPSTSTSSPRCIEVQRIQSAHAQQLNIQPGDQFVSVGGKNVENLGLRELQALLAKGADKRSEVRPLVVEFRRMVDDDDEDMEEEEQEKEEEAANANNSEEQEEEDPIDGERRLHQAIFAYFQSLDGTPTPGPPKGRRRGRPTKLNARPILDALRHVFPHSNFPQMDSVTGAELGRELAHRYVDHPRLVQKVDILETAVKNAPRLSPRMSTSGWAPRTGGTTSMATSSVGTSSSSAGRKRKAATGINRDGSNEQPTEEESTAHKKSSRKLSEPSKRSRRSSGPAAIAKTAAVTGLPALSAKEARAASSVVRRSFPGASPSKEASVDDVKAPAKVPPGKRTKQQKNYPTTPHKTWELMYQELVCYQRGYNHCRVPQKHNVALNKWVFAMKKAYEFYQEKKARAAPGEVVELPTDERVARDHLTVGRVRKLDALGFDWAIKKIIPWNTRYEELKEFQAKEGHTRVPRSYPNKLGEWVHQQRQKHPDKAKGVKHKMSRERMKLLDDIGFQWAVSEEKKTWEDRYQALVTYRRCNGHLEIFKDENIYDTAEAKSYDDDGGDKTKACLSLVRWAEYQRREYRKFVCGEQSRLNKTKIKMLQDLGMDLLGADTIESIRQKGIKKLAKPDRGPRVPWEDRFQQLLEFKANEGHCRVPQNWKPDPKLNLWVNEQRRHYRLKQEGKKNNLSDENEKRLLDAGFEFRILAKNKKRSATVAGLAAGTEHALASPRRQFPGGLPTSPIGRQVPGGQTVVGLHEEDEGHSDSDEYEDAQDDFEPSDLYYS